MSIPPKGFDRLGVKGLPESLIKNVARVQSRRVERWSTKTPPTRNPNLLHRRVGSPRLCLSKDHGDPRFVQLPGVRLYPEPSQSS